MGLLVELRVFEHNLAVLIVEVVAVECQQNLYHCEFVQCLRLLRISNQLLELVGKFVIEVQIVLTPKDKSVHVLGCAFLRRACNN